MKKILLALAPLLTLLSCASQDRLPEQKTVPHVDLSRYMGRWYVIGAIPTMFEDGAVNATETYSWNAGEDRIDVDFRFRKDSPDGREKSIPQKAFVENKQTNAEWVVQLFWPLKGGYLILDLADDYSHVLVGMPNRSHAWIMARKPKLDDKIYDRLAAKLTALGYETKKLKLVPQVW